MENTVKDRLILIFKYTFLIMFAIACIYPLVWLFINSFKTNQELYENPWGIAITAGIKNYISALVEGNVARYFLNSVIVAVTAVFANTILSSMAAFAIARMKWKLSKLTHSIFIMGMLIPVYATIIPLFSIFKAMNLLNTRMAVIIAYTAMNFPIAIFILTGFFKTIPTDIEEAAIIDGCSIFTIFRKVIFPLSQSSIVTVAVITFITMWNDLLLPQIFLTNKEKMTLPVGLTEFQGQYATDYVSMIAAVVITIIPSIIVYIFLHNNIMEGMVAGAVKG